MSPLRSFRRGRDGGRLWLVGATLFAAFTFGVVFVASSGATPSPCPIPGSFEIDGDMTQHTCNPAADDWNTPNIGVQSTTQGGTYKTASKDDGDPSGWSSSGQTPNKTDFDRAYATSRVVAGHFYVFVAWERTFTNGTQGYAIEIDNSGSNVAADGTPQPKRASGGAVFYISSQGSSAPQFDSACSFTSQSNYGQTCTSSSASITAAINTASISDPLRGTTQTAGSFFETALDVTALTGIAPSCPGPSAASVYLRSITGQTKNGNLKGYVAPLSVAPDSTCVTPPISTTNMPGGSAILPGATQHDEASVGTQTAPGVGSVKFFLCSPGEVTANGGDCSANGTQVGSVVTLDSNGHGSSSDVSGSTTPSDHGIGKYCWRAEFTPSSNDHHYLSGKHTNSSSECFTIIKASPSIATTASVTGSGVVGTDSTSDSATVSGGDHPSGSIQFSIKAPDGSTSTVGSPVTVNGDGTYSAPSSVALAEVGTYTWSASYSGDSFNNGAVDNGSNESVNSHKASPSIATRASVSANGVVGTDSTSDSATVSGGDHPSGSIQFSIKAPDGSTSMVGSPVTVNGDGTYSAPSSVALAEVGTYTWSASYSGDSLNNGAVDNGSNESVTSSQASPSIRTTPSPSSGSVGDVLQDSAILAAGDHPTGTITFDLYDNGTCTGPALHEETASVSGNGTYSTSQGYTSTKGITYYWVASYGGDSKNKSAAAGCADEPVAISAPSIHIVKMADAAQVMAGAPIGFTLTVYNDGSGAAKNVKLSDPLPTKAGLSWSIAGMGIGWGASGCSISGSTLSCGGANGVTVPGGTTQAGSTLTVHVTSPTTASTGGGCPGGSGVVDNIGTVTASNAGSDDSKASTCVAAPGIHIIKTADAPEVSAGHPIGFTLTVYNDGSGDATSVKLSDLLPNNAGLSWSIDSQGAGWADSCSISGSTLSCGGANGVTVPAGTTFAGSTFTVHITSPTTSATGGDCEVSSGVVDNTGTVTTGNGGSDESNAAICVALADVHVIKSADAPQVHAGAQIGFTLTVYNDGAGDATGVKLSDALPSKPGLSWSIASQGAGWAGSCAISNGVLSCGGANGVTVPANTIVANSTFTVHIVSGTTEATGGSCPGGSGVVDNTGTVTSGNDGSEQSTASTCVEQSVIDLAVTKSGSPNPDTLPGNITWTMVVTNHGPDTATGVKIADPMPAGNTYVSSTTSKGTCTGGALLQCSLGTMATGTSVTITLITTPSAAGTVTNTVTVVGNETETNYANNTASASVLVVGPHKPVTFCVAVSKVTPKQLFVGRKTVLTIHLTKQGHAVKGVRVRINGPKLNMRTQASNSKGVIKQKVRPKKAGIVIFTPIASKACGTKRLGVTGVFTPPVTG